MIYNLKIEIPDTDLEDVIVSMSKKYRYTDKIDGTKEIVVPAVLDQEGRIVEAEKTVEETIKIDNPISLLEHMGNVISEDIKLLVQKDRRNKLLEEAELAIDEDNITPGMDVTIS